MLHVRKVSTAAALVAGFGLANALHAAIVASDSITASNPAYAPANGETVADDLNGTNGGTGFNPWVVTDIESPPASGATHTSLSGNGGAFASSSNNVTNDGSNVRNPAPVFDVFDNGNPGGAGTLNSSIETATRAFPTSMWAGSAFSFVQTIHNLKGLDSSSNQTSVVGFQLLDTSGAVLLDMHISGGETGAAQGWYVSDYNHPVAGGVQPGFQGYEMFSTDSAHSGAASRNLDYNINESDTVSVQILDAIALPNGDIVGDYQIITGGHRGSTYADGGQILLGTGGPAAFAIYDNDGGNASDVAVNNLSLSVVPEPASLSVIGLGLCTLVRRRRR